MKKLVVVVTLVIALAVAPALAVQKGTSITMNPLSMLFGIISGEVNLSISPNVSVPVNGAYFSMDSGGYDYTIFSIGGGLRYYWEGNAINGWYIGPTLNYAMSEVAYTDIFDNKGEVRVGAISFGALVGYQSVWDNGFTLDLGLGVQRLTIPGVEITIDNTTYSSDKVSWTIPQLKLAIGYAF